MRHTAVLPRDDHNEKLLASVRPRDWKNPQPDGRYNLVVVGAGTAGLITAAGAAGLGARVALVERQHMGGDCLNVGCVPSKALVRAARSYADVRDSGEFGVEVPAGVSVDFSRVMERMRRLRASISPNDSAARYTSLGVDVYFGQARFCADDTVEVGGQRLRYRKAVIATGARALRPTIEGIEETGYLTNETVFSLTELPRRLIVIGAGPIGCELAQAFARFGSEVTVVANHDRILAREDSDAVDIVQRSLERDGVRVETSARTLRARRDREDRVLVIEQKGVTRELRADAILIGVGRQPNVEQLGLEEAGVEFDPREGVLVDDRLRTTNRRIYAAGDICSRFKFTHAADAMARIAIQNACFLGRAKASALVIPWSTYTAPEIAHVGLYEDEARERGIGIDTLIQRFHDVDRAILDGESEGFVKVHVRRGTDEIVGATIVAAHAGDMISELTLAMVARVGLKTVARTIHPYPTQAEAIKRAADAFNRTRLTPRVLAGFRKWFSWTR